jgi:uncharacterized C2H2 Zn-finger protein
MEEEVLEKRKRILGEDHPDTILALANLAFTLRGLGNYDKALSMEEEVLEKRKRILGEDHPDTILALANLASTVAGLGKADEAFLMKKEVLKKWRRIMGEDHPDTIHAMGQLADMFYEQGKWHEASSMEKEILERRKRILCDDHPDTIRVMDGLRDVLHRQGSWDAALSMQRESLEKRKRMQGEDHPDTISALEDLACTLNNLGETDEGLAMQKEVLEIRKRVLGEDHPDTISALEDLACTLDNLGKADEALSMQKEVLEIRKRVPDNQHPDPIGGAKENLAASGAGPAKANEITTVRESLSKSEHKNKLGNVHQDNDSLLECPGCTKQFPLQKSLSQHMMATGHTATESNSPGESESDEDDSEYGNYLDENDFPQEAISTEADDTIFKCPGCTKQFPLQKSLSQHMNATGHTAKQPDSPGESESEEDDSEYGNYLDENDFHQEDISTEADDTIFKCPGCTKQFPLQKSLSQHIKATGHSTY